MPKGDVALDEDLGEPSAVSESDLTSGLEVRKPAISRTGTYVSADGAVLTTTEVLDGCTRITLDGRHDATLAFRDDKLGIALLKPATALAPRGVATLETAVPRPDTDVALAGYSYGEALSAPVVTFGNFAEAKGLNGEPDLVRLSATTLPGDSGAAGARPGSAAAGDSRAGGAPARRARAGNSTRTALASLNIAGVTRFHAPCASGPAGATCRGSTAA